MTENKNINNAAANENVQNETPAKSTPVTTGTLKRSFKRVHTCCGGCKTCAHQPKNKISSTV